MEQSEEERQLLQLLRGQDIPEFSLQISLKERNPYPIGSGARGWQSLERPVWTVAMSVPQAVENKTTTSSRGLSEAWTQQGLWWRSPTLRAAAGVGRDYREVMNADRIARAETQFLGIVRGDAGGELVVTISVEAGHWTINLRVPGTAGQGTTGDGPSFAYAWTHDWPWWRD